MNISTKLLKAAAGSAGGAGLDVDEVFSTFLYDGNGSTQTITNNIDLSGEGGLVWMKSRTGTDEHTLMDTERGTGTYLISHSTQQASSTSNAYITSYNSNGFSIGAGNQINRSSENFVSWTFRKAPKFFDVVTYTGNGANGRQISHNLNSDVGMAIIKKSSASGDWWVWHRSAPNNTMSILNGNNAFTTSAINSEYPSEVFGDGNFDQDPTSTFFEVSSFASNENGVDYVAYLFAHNNSDGGFGRDSDQDIIKCDSYTGNGSNTGSNSVTLGFEPQFVMIKRADSSGNWVIVDNMRGMFANGTGNDAILQWNSTSDESSLAQSVLEPTSTGFKLRSAGGDFNGNGGTYIYMAIRRGPLAVPEDATKVFNVLKETSATLNQSPPYLQQTGFPVDVVSNKTFNASSSWWTATRLTNARLQLESTDAETGVSTTHEFDHNDGVAVNGLTGSSNFVGYHWRRAPGYFDVVAYTGNSVAGRNINHNLGVAPEMMWVKRRSDANNWTVYHKGLDATEPEDYGIYLDDTAQRVDSVNFWNDTAPTSSVFTVGTASKTNANTATYIAYLFATVAGVSKVGSYTGTGSTQNIDCGFSNGARFVIIKRTDSADDWIVVDTERGIVSGNDPYLALNTTDPELTSQDYVDPYSSGFAVTGENPVGANSGTYIFYAIA